MHKTKVLSIKYDWLAVLIDNFEFFARKKKFKPSVWCKITLLASRIIYWLNNVLSNETFHTIVHQADDEINHNKKEENDWKIFPTAPRPFNV